MNWLVKFLLCSKELGDFDMAKVHFSKEGLTLEVTKETSVLSLALENKIELTHRCGAEVRCSSCKFRVLEGKDAFSVPTEAEKKLLEKFRYPDFIRLGCQAKINPDYEGEIEIGTIVKTHNKQTKPVRIPARFQKTRP